MEWNNLKKYGFSMTEQEYIKKYAESGQLLQEYKLHFTDDVGKKMQDIYVCIAATYDFTASYLKRGCSNAEFDYNEIFEKLNLIWWELRAKKIQMKDACEDSLFKSLHNADSGLLRKLTQSIFFHSFGMVKVRNTSLSLPVFLLFNASRHTHADNIIACLKILLDRKKKEDDYSFIRDSPICLVHIKHPEVFNYLLFPNKYGKVLTDEECNKIRELGSFYLGEECGRIAFPIANKMFSLLCQEGTVTTLFGFVYQMSLSSILKILTSFTINEKMVRVDKEHNVLHVLYFKVISHFITEYLKDQSYQFPNAEKEELKKVVMFLTERFPGLFNKTENIYNLTRESLNCEHPRLPDLFEKRFRWVDGFNNINYSNLLSGILQIPGISQEKTEDPNQE